MNARHGVMVSSPTTEAPAESAPASRRAGCSAGVLTGGIAGDEDIAATANVTWLHAFVLVLLLTSLLAPTPKSAREKDLERDIKTVTDPKQKRWMREELDELRQERELQDARLRAVATLTEEQRQQRIYQRAQQSGSRFNLRYPERVVLEKLTPDSVMQALAQYVDFAAPGPTTARAGAETGPAGIHKGMLETDVDILLGRPVEVRRGKEGLLDVSRCTYEQGENAVEALFVEGVLVRYTITSE